MSKKEYIMMILNALENDWPLAKDLQRFILLDKFDADGLDGLSEIMSKTVEQFLSNETKEKLKHAVDAVQKIKQLEQQDMLADETEIAGLESMIQKL